MPCTESLSRARPKLVLRAGAFAFLAAIALPMAAASPRTPPPGGPPPPLPPEILAQQPKEPPPGLPDAATLREELTLLYEFLSAPPEKLARMRRKIEMIERMSPENREFLRVRLVQLQADAPALQAEIDEMTQGFPHEVRSVAVRYWLSLRPPERDAERKRMQALEEARRGTYLRERIEIFEAAQAALRSSLLESDGGPPDFIPPPPPFLRGEREKIMDGSAEQ